MKKRLFLISIWVLTCISSMCQTPNPIKGFSELRLNYNLSYISQDPFTTYMGIAFGSNYSFTKKLSIDAALTIKPTRRENKEFDVIGDWGYYDMHVNRQLSALFIDLPIHVNYQILNYKTFSFSLSSGPRLFYLNTSYFESRSYNSQEANFFKVDRDNLNLGLDLGFVQRITITERVGLFASEHYGQALLGYSKGFESTDLNFGITYKIK